MDKCYRYTSNCHWSSEPGVGDKPGVPIQPQSDSPRNLRVFGGHIINPDTTVQSVRTRSSGRSSPMSPVVQDQRGSRRHSMQNISLVRIPIHKTSCDSAGTQHQHQGHHQAPLYHSSMPSLVPLDLPRGGWPSNVTSITTRSIVRPSTRCIAGSNSETDISRYSRRHHHHHSSSSSTYKRKLHRSRHHSERYREEIRQDNIRNGSMQVAPPSISAEPSPGQQWHHLHYQQQDHEIENLKKQLEATTIASERLSHSLQTNQTLLNDVTKLLQSVNDLEQRLCSYQRLPQAEGLLKDILDQLTELHQKVYSNSETMERLVRNLDSLQQDIRETRSRELHDSHYILTTSDNVVRRWKHAAAETDNRKDVASKAMTLIRQIEPLLHADEEWLSCLSEDINRIASLPNINVEDSQRILECIKKPFDQLLSRSARIEHINELAADFIQQSKLYEKSIEQYRNHIIQTSPNEPLPYRVPTCSTSGLLSLRRRVEKFNRYYADSLSICNDLVHNLTERIANVDNSASFHMTIQDASQLIDTYREKLSNRYNILGNSSESEESETVNIPIRASTGKTSQRNLSSSEMITSENLKWIGQVPIFRPPGHRQVFSINEALVQRLIDADNETLFNPANDSRHALLDCGDYAVISILTKKLQLVPNGRQMNLLQAISRNLIDLSLGCIHCQHGQCLSPSEAYHQGLIDKQMLSALRDLFATLHSSSLPSHITDNLNALSDKPLTLQECHELNIISPSNGFILNPVDGRYMTLEEAIKRKLVATDVAEIIYSGSVSKLTLEEAINRKVIDPVTNEFHDFGNRFNLHQIVTGDHFVETPVTLSQAFVLNLMDDRGEVIHRRTSKKVSFSDAMNAHILDSKSKHIVHPVTKNLLSITDAIQLTILDHAGNFTNPTTGEQCTLLEAVKKNKLQLISFKPTMKGATVMDTASKRLISIAEATGPGRIIDVTRNQFLNTSSNIRTTIKDAIINGWILPEYNVYMGKTLTINQPNSRHISTIEHCLSTGSIDLINFTLNLSKVREATGAVADSNINNNSNNISGSQHDVVAISVAVAKGLISQDDALLLKEVRGTVSYEAYITAYIADDVKKNNNNKNRRRNSSSGGSGNVPDEAGMRFVFKPAPNNLQFLDLNNYNITNKNSNNSDTSALETARYCFRDDVERHLLSSRTVYDISDETLRQQRRSSDDMTSKLRNVSFIDAVNSQMLNIDSGKLIEPLTRSSISIDAALRNRLLNPETAYIIDASRDKTFNLQGAVNEGLITADNRIYDKKTNHTMNIADAIKTGILRIGDSTLPSYSVISKTESLTLRSVKDCKRNEYIEPTKAIKLKILDLYQSAYFDQLNDRKYTIDDAIAKGFIRVQNVAESTNDQQRNVISTSLIRETRSYDMTGVFDTLTQSEMSIRKAIEMGIVDRYEGRYLSRKTNEWLTITDAINRGLIKVTLAPMHHDDSTVTSKSMVKETKTYALGSARDTSTGEMISINSAIQKGIIDQKTGLYHDTRNNETMPISLAVEKNYIISEEEERSTSVDNRLRRGPMYVQRDVKYLLIEQIIEPKTKDMLTIEVAIRRGIIDRHSCVFFDTSEQKAISLTEAFNRGYIVGRYIGGNDLHHVNNQLIAKISREERSYLINAVLDTRDRSRLNLDDAIRKGIFNPDRAVYVNPLTAEESSLNDAIQAGLVDARIVGSDHRPITQSSSSVYSTKVIRIAKSDDDHTRTSRPDVSGQVYKVDTVEEFVEAMGDGQAGRTNRSEVHHEETSRSDQHSHYQKIYHKERNVKEKDVIMRSSQAFAEEHVPRRQTIEEIVIDEGRVGNEIDIKPEPRSKLRPIVIEDDGRKGQTSHVIVVDEHQRTVSGPRPEILRSYVQPATPAVPHEADTAAYVARIERIPEKTHILATHRVEDDVIYEDRYQKSPSRYEMDRTDITTTRIIRDEERVHTRSVSKEVQDDQTIQERKLFVDEVLNKARAYKESMERERDSSTSEYVTTKECTYVVKGMIHTLSWVLEPETRQKISLVEGIEKKIFDTTDMTYNDYVENRKYHIEEAVRMGLIGTDEDTSPVIVNADGITYTITWVLDPLLKYRILPRKAIQKNILDVDRLRYFNPRNNVSVSIHEAVKMKFMGAIEKRPDSDEITITIDNHTVRFSWVLDSSLNERCGSYEALKRGLIDLNQCIYLKKDTGDIMTLWDALHAGFIGIGDDYAQDNNALHKSGSVTSLDEDELTISTRTATYVITGVVHPVTQEELKVSDAITLGILDKETGAYRDLNTGVVYELADAINDGLMYATIVESKESTEMETSSVKHIIQRYIVKTVIDPRNGKTIGGLQAQAAGILNYAQGMYTDPDSICEIPIREAIDQRLIEVELINQTSDEQFELDLIKDSLLERRIITFNIYNVVDPVIEANISAQEAADRGILDSDTKTYFNAATGQFLELQEAMSMGFLQADVKEKIMRKPLSLSLQNASRLGFYNYDTGVFRDPYSETSMPLHEAVERGHIHANSPAIASLAHGPVTLRDALYKGLINRSTGKLDRERLAAQGGVVADAKIQRINFEDAVRVGLIDLQTGMYKHLHTGEALELKDAISRGLLDGENVVVEHPVTETYMTLTQALDTMSIGKQGILSDLSSSKNISTLEKEFNQRRLFSIFNVNTGEIFITRTGEMMSFEKAMARNKVDSRFRLFHFKTNKEYSVTEAAEHGILDPDTGRIFDNIHRDPLSIRDAIRRGVVCVAGAPMVPIKADHDALAVRLTSRKRRLSSRTRSGGVLQTGTDMEYGSRSSRHRDELMRPGQKVSISNQHQASSSRRIPSGHKMSSAGRAT